MNHYAKRETELPLWRRIAAWMGLLFLLALMVFFFWAPMHAQERSNTYYAAQFAGANVGAKITAAQAQCSPNTDIPCTIVIDAILAGWPQGTPPARCAQCYWIDYTSVTGWKVTPLVFTPTNLTIAEAAAPAGVAASDILYADSTAHRWKMLNNNGVATQVVASGNDINTSDQVTQLHFGATATPLSGTAPTTGQFLQWNGTNVVGATGSFTSYSTPSASVNASITATTMTTASASGNKYLFSAVVIQTAVGVGCTGVTTVAVNAIYTDNVLNSSQSISLAGFGEDSVVAALPKLTASGFFNGIVGFDIQYFVLPINAKASTAVQYSTTYGLGAGCTTGPAYYVLPTLQQVQ